MKEINNGQPIIDFDFDYWMELAKQDPDAFEKQRLNLMQTTINEAPQKMHRRLNGLQWTIDSKIKTAKNPMDGCLKVYQMMMDSVYEDRGLLEALTMKSSDFKESSDENVIQINNALEIER